MFSVDTSVASFSPYLDIAHSGYGSIWHRLFCVANSTDTTPIALSKQVQKFFLCWMMRQVSPVNLSNLMVSCKTDVCPASPLYFASVLFFFTCDFRPNLRVFTLLRHAIPFHLLLFFPCFPNNRFGLVAITKNLLICALYTFMIIFPSKLLYILGCTFTHLAAQFFIFIE